MMKMMMMMKMITVMMLKVEITIMGAIYDHGSERHSDGKVEYGGHK